MALTSALFRRPRHRPRPSLGSVEEAYAYLATTDSSRRLRQSLNHRPPRWLSVLATEPRDRRLNAVFANPHAPASLLARYANHASPRVRAAVAASPSTPPSVLTALLYSYAEGPFHLDIWTALAANPSTPDHLLATILSCGHRSTLPALLERPHLPASIIDFIVARARRAADVSLLLDVARHPSTPDETLFALATNPVPALHSELSTRAAARDLPALHLALRLASAGLYRDDPAGLQAAAEMLLTTPSEATAELLA